MSESSKLHKAKAPKILNFGVYICSTSRYKLLDQGAAGVSDVGGDTIVELLKTLDKMFFSKK